MSNDSDTPRKHLFRMSKITLTLAICCIIAIGASVFFYLKYQESQNTEASHNTRILDKVNKAVQLPDEAPVLVTVSDKSKLTNQQLAAKVENDDIMLIFAQSKRLIVYRPSIDKVVDILSFNTAEELPTKTKK